jgi:hypothetical protein
MRRDIAPVHDIATFCMLQEPQITTDDPETTRGHGTANVLHASSLRGHTLGSLRLEAFARWSPRREYCSWAQPETVSNQVNAPAMRSMHRRDSQCSAWSDRSPRVHVSRYRTSAPTANERGHTEAVRYALSPAAPPRLQASSDGLR